jgi:hypothetical protein
LIFFFFFFSLFFSLFRAHNVLEREQLLDRYTEANLLGARSLLGARDVDGALELLGESDESSAVWEKSSDARDENTVLLSSRTAMWRAHVFLALENRHQGAHWLVEALRRDPMNYEAFAALKEKHLLTSEQEEEVEHCVRKAPLDQTLIWEMYGCKLAVYAPKQIAVTAPLDVDLETARAENLYYSSRTAEALRVCKAVWDVQGASTLLTSV